jgi:hypothetical protein
MNRLRLLSSGRVRPSRKAGQNIDAQYKQEKY